MLHFTPKFLTCATALGLAATALAAPPAYDIVFFDLPEALEPNPIPSPSPDLAALPGYPVDPNQLTLAAAVYPPDPLLHGPGPGPYPTIIILHGSGGLWSNDVIANDPSSQFEDWAEVLTDRGYLCLLPDSYNPRGIEGNFSGKRPHHDPALDDALCSPNYERPKDVIAALTYLDGRTDVDRDHIGILAFSHGAQTGLNALMDPSIDKSPYTVSYIDAMNDKIDLVVDDPVEIPNSLPFPKVFACYYPGGSHYGYHGQASSIVADRYMPDQRVEVIMFHGTDDSLLGVDDPDVTPMTGNLYPIKFVESSQLHADSLAIPNPFIAHHIFDEADHSFDNEDIEPEINWNTGAENPDEKAKRLARDETLKWFAHRLKPATHITEEDPNDASLLQLRWHGEAGIDYTVQACPDLESWADVSAPTIGLDAEMTYSIDPEDASEHFFRLASQPTPAPTADPDNAGFFRDYGDFNY